MKEVATHGIFPVPVYFSELERDFTKKELKFFDKNKLTTYPNSGNITSEDAYILDNSELADLKAECMVAVQRYVDNIMSFKSTVQPYITQSWLNFTETGQYHHKHAHSNSIISGVIYVNADEENDKIYFHNDGYKQIKPQINEWNLYNSESWYFTVKTGQVVLFPSNLTHMVQTKAGDNTRISLAFNVFLKGTIGVDRELTELKL
jgi:uncharacterized protein (TIGR02466 family)